MRPSWFKLLGLESFQENQESVGIGENFKKSAGGARAMRRRLAVPQPLLKPPLASVLHAASAQRSGSVLPGGGFNKWLSLSHERFSLEGGTLL